MNWASGKKSNEMPHVVVMTLGSDHTNGTNPGSPTPRAMVADNDLALGRIVEGISKSRFWPKSLILVVEDDAAEWPRPRGWPSHRASAIDYVARIVDTNLLNHGIAACRQLMLLACCRTPPAQALGPRAYVGLVAIKADLEIRSMR